MKKINKKWPLQPHINFLRIVVMSIIHVPLVSPVYCMNLIEINRNQILGIGNIICCILFFAVMLNKKVHLFHTIQLRKYYVRPSTVINTVFILFPLYSGRRTSLKSVSIWKWWSGKQQQSPRIMLDRMSLNSICRRCYGFSRNKNNRTEVGILSTERK